MSKRSIAVILTAGSLFILFAACRSGNNISSESSISSKSNSQESPVVSEIPEETISETPESVFSSEIEYSRPGELEDISYNLVGESIYLDTQDYQEVVDRFAEVLETGERSLPSVSWYAVSDYLLLEAYYETDGDRYDFEVDTQYFDEDAAFRGNFRRAVKPLDVAYPVAGGDEIGEGEYEGYIMQTRAYYFHTDGEGNWTCLARAYR